MNNALAPTFTGDDSSVTVFRPTPWLWLPITLYVVFQGYFCGSLIISSIQNHFALGFEIILTLIALLPIAPFIVILAIAQIRVDAETLQWRTWSGWKRVVWRDVLDYFELHQSNKYGTPTYCVVITPLGQCQFMYGGIMPWTHSTILRQVIDERAVKARAREWGVRGARPEIDWPLISKEERASSPWIISAIFLLPCILVGVWACYKAVPAFWAMVLTIWTGLGWGWGVASLLVFLPFVPLVFCVLTFVTSIVKMNGNQLKRQITISQDGFQYRDTQRQINAKWSDVVSVKTVDANPLAGRMRTYVETNQGSFDLPLAMQDYHALDVCFKAQVEAPIHEEGSRRVQSEHSQHQGSVSVTYPEVYGYRISACRTLLLVLTAILVLCSIPSMIDFSMETPLRLTFSHGITSAVGLVPVLIGWLAYFTARVILDAEGVTSQMFFRKRQILWRDVQRVSVNGAEPFRRISIVGPNTRIGYLSLIADSEHLAAEIQRRTGRETELS